MSSVSADLADALKADAEHDDRDWPVTLTIRREYLYPLERAKMGDVKRLSIFPFEHTSEREGRNAIASERGIGFILRAAAKAADTNAVDTLIETIEALIDRYLLTPVNYGGTQDAVPQRVVLVNGDQVYDVDRLGKTNVFQGGFVITHQTRS
ncbi:MAG: hypothetical protein AAGC72_01120 [Planctomycetota bacterium]